LSDGAIKKISEVRLNVSTFWHFVLRTAF